MDSEEVKDRKMKIVNLTNYLIELYPTGKSLALIVLTSIIAGILGYFLLASAPLPETLAYGAVMGLFLLALPAFITGYITTFFTMFSGKKLLIHRSTYLTFFSTLILAVLYIVGCGLGTMQSLLDLLIFGYVIIFAIRTFVLMITCPYNIFQSVALALLQPLFGIVVIYYYPLLSGVSSFFPVVAVALLPLLAKAGIALATLSVGIAIFIVLIDAPMKRNFGINTLELAKHFIAHWYDQSTAIEEVLKRIGEKADSLVSIIAFKAKRRLRLIFVIPCLHPGPFGEVGGGKLTRIFTEVLEKETGASVVIAHGSATHDLNPITTDSLYAVTEGIVDGLDGMTFSTKASHSVRNKTGKAKLMGQKFGDTAFLVSTFSPNATEDIDFSIGLSLINSLKKEHKDVIYSDAHNCHQSGYHTPSAGDVAIFDLLEGAEKMSKKLKRSRGFAVRQGFAVDPLSEYSVIEGVGPIGLRVLVVEAGRQKTAYVIFDANNMVAGLREEIIKRVKKMGIDEVEVMTTDSHCVNNVRGVENPLGMNVDTAELVKRAEETTKRAVKDMQKVSVGTRVIRVRGIDVLGSQKSIELVSTINSMIAMMKIATPLIFMSALFVALLGVLFIPW